MIESLREISKNKIEEFISICDEVRGDSLLLKIQFEKKFSNFDVIKFFLLQLDIIVERENNIQFPNSLTKNNLEELLLKKIVASKKDIFIQFQSYLKKFQKNKQGDFEYSPEDLFENTTDQIIRDFLIDFQIIYNKEFKFHIFQDQVELFKDLFKNSSMSPSQLKSKQENDLKLGQAAERNVLDFERKRLDSYPELLSKIDYIAEKNVSAGYDILSWEIDIPDTERYIEVKAVSANKYFEFHWTKNEIEIAEILKDQYFLYLVPVQSAAPFSFKNPTIIQHPFNNVFGSTEWLTEHDGYIVKKTLNE